MNIDTPLLVVGDGPGALVAAKLAGGWGLGCMLVGHSFVGGPDPVVLEPDAVELLKPHGLFDVLRPYLDAVNPPTIAALTFEEGVKHHCVVDMNVTVFDGLDVVDVEPVGEGATAVMTDGKVRWNVHADAFVDASGFPTELNAAIRRGAEAAAWAIAASHAAQER